MDALRPIFISHSVAQYGTELYRRGLHFSFVNDDNHRERKFDFYVTSVSNHKYNVMWIRHDVTANVLEDNQKAKDRIKSLMLTNSKRQLNNETVVVLLQRSYETLEQFEDLQLTLLDTSLNMGVRVRCIPVADVSAVVDALNTLQRGRTRRCPSVDSSELNHRIENTCKVIPGVGHETCIGKLLPACSSLQGIAMEQNLHNVVGHAKASTINRFFNQIL